MHKISAPNTLPGNYDKQEHDSDQAKICALPSANYGRSLFLPHSTSVKLAARVHLPPFRYSRTALAWASNPKPLRPC